MGILKIIFALLLLSSSAYAKFNPDGSEILSHHVPKVVRLGLAAKIDHVPAGQVMDLRILFPSKDQAGLESFLKNELYNPKSPNYRKFLTIDQFNLRYGASSTDTEFVLSYLRKNGFNIRKRSKTGFVIAATAPVSTVESVFKVNINTYKNLSDGTTFFSTDSDPTVAPEIAGKFYAVAGLDNAIRFHPHIYRERLLQPLNSKGTLKTIDLNTKTNLVLHLAGTVTVSPKVNMTPAVQTFLGFGGSMGPTDIFDIYNLNPVSSNGSGQTIGVFELDGYVAGDIGQFESNYGLPNMTLTIIPTDVTDCTNDVNSGETGCDDVTDCLNNSLCTNTPESSETAGANTDEVVADIDLDIAVAPGVSSVRVYEAPNSADGWIDQWDAIASDNSRPKAISVSWGGDEADNFPGYDHTVFSTLAALGVSVFASAGDAGAYDNCDAFSLPPNCTVQGNPATGVLSVDDPASDPYVTSVGISVATASNPDTINEAYGSETASLYGGGGVSSYVSITSPNPGDYQLTAATSYYNATSHSFGSTTMRNVPDVVLTADPDTIYGIYVSDQSPPGWYAFAGSSLAAPIWAGFTTLVNEGRVGLGESSIGFLNPDLYQVDQSSRASNDFHDIPSGSTNSYYPTETGYDDATGLGSFNGANLYSDLIGLPQPTALNATAGNAQVSLSWTAPSSGTVTSYIVSRATAQIGPYTAVSTLNPSSPCATVSSTSCVDNGLTNTDTYYYEVSGVNAAGIEGADSTSANATPGLPPLAPTGLNATGGNAQVSLNWTASAGATSYNIKRSTTSGAEVTVASSNTNSYTDTSLTNGQVYYYEVSAVNGAGESPNSSEANATPFGPPSGFTAAGATGQVNLSWTNETTAVSYNIYKSTTSGGETLLTNISSPGTSYNDSAVSNGTAYYYEITAVNGGSVESVKSSEITATPLAIPTGLNATGGNTQVSLNWTAVTGATSYHIKRSTTSGAEVTVASSGTNSYTDTSLTNGQIYYYEVSAVDTGGESTNSTESNATPFGPPSGFTAAGATGQVNLSWTSEATAASYNIYKSTTSGGETLLTNVSSPGTSYNDSAVSNGTAYYYEITAVNGGSVESVKSSEITATPLAIPTGLTATPGNLQVSLNWTAVTGATSYHIKRSTTSGAEVTVASSGTNSYTDTSLTNGQIYYYEVSAVDTGGESTNSTESNATPFGPPSGFTAAGATGQVNLSWTSEATAASYNIYRSTTSGGETLLTNVSSPGTSYNDSAVSNGTAYYYEITAVNGGSVESIKSSEITATPLGVPTGLVATPGNLHVVLSWTGVTGATSYHVKRSTTSGAEATVATVTAPTTTYNDTGLTNGQIYYYEVSAVDTGGESTNSTESNATPFGPPSGFTAAGATGQVNLSWTSEATAASYNIYRSTTSGGETLLTNVSSPGTSYNDSAVSNGTAYYYEITAVNGGSVESIKSSEITATPLAIPTGLVATPGNAAVSLSWTGITGATGYHVKRSTTSGGEVTVATSGTNSYTDSGLTNGDTYYYEISAIDTGGESSNSSEASTIAGLPTPPTTVSAVGGNQQATVYFSGGSANGSSIVQYTVTPYIGASAQATVSGPSSPIIVTGLTNFTAYTFTVTLTNTVGTSSVSVASSSVTPTPLAPPSALQATILGAKIGSHINYIGAYLTWTQSPDPSVTQNNIYRSLNGGSFALIATINATTSYKDASTTSGTTYTYRVTASKPGPIESAPTNVESVNY